MIAQAIVWNCKFYILPFANTFCVGTIFRERKGDERWE